MKKFVFLLIFLFLLYPFIFGFSNYYISIIAFVLGFYCIYATFDTLKKERAKKSSSYEKIVGKIVDYKYSDTNDNIDVYSPIIEYEYNGKKYRYHDANSSSNMLKLNKETTIYVNKNNPHDVIANSSIMIAFVTLFFAIVCFYVGLGFLFNWLD